MKHKLVSITLDRQCCAYTEACLVKITPQDEKTDLWTIANQFITAWRMAEDPETLGCEKLDFVLEFADGALYQGTYELYPMIARYPPHPLLRHVGEHLAFHAGLWWPPHLSAEQIKQGDHLLSLNWGLKDRCLKWLNEYDIPYEVPEGERRAA